MRLVDVQVPKVHVDLRVLQNNNKGNNKSTGLQERSPPLVRFSQLKNRQQILEYVNKYQSRLSVRDIGGALSQAVKYEGEAEGNKLSELCQQILLQKLQHIKSKEACQIFYALSLLGQNNEIYELLKHKLLQPGLMQELSCRNLCNLIYAAAQLGHTAIIEKLSYELVQRRSTMFIIQEQEISNVFYSLGKIKFGNQFILNKLSRIAIHSPQNQYTAQGYSNILLACAYLNYCDQHFMGFITQKLLKKADFQDWNSQSLSNIVWAYGKLKYSNRELVQRMVESILLNSNIQIRHLVAALEGLVGIRTLEVDQIEQIYSKLKQMQSLEGRVLVSVTHSLAFCRFFQKQIISEIIQKFENSDLRSYNNQQIASILLSFVQWKTKESDFLVQKLKNQFLDNLNQNQNIQSICNVMWAIAALDILEMQNFVQLCQQISYLQSQYNSQCSSEEFRQICEVALLIYEGQKDWPEDVQNFVFQVLQKVTKQIRQKNRVGNKKIKAQVWKISQFLTQNDIQHTKNSEVAEGLFIAQIKIYNSPVIVDFETPVQFMISPKSLRTGCQIMKQKILSKLGYLIVQIPYYEFKVANEKGVINEYLQDKLKMIF